MEILQFAIAMELDGEKYYSAQAAKNEGNPLQTVFRSLAKDEAKHAMLLQSKVDSTPYTLVDHDDLTGQLSLFYQSDDFKNAVEALPDQVEVYMTALDLEKKSIDLYTDMYGKASDNEAKELFNFLIEEEKHHFAVIEELYHHVNRPNEWVESAEFGVREEY